MHLNYVRVDLNPLIIEPSTVLKIGDSEIMFVSKNLMDAEINEAVAKASSELIKQVETANLKIEELEAKLKQVRSREVKTRKQLQEVKDVEENL